MAASQTEFGKYYNFADILSAFRKGPRSFTTATARTFPFIPIIKSSTNGGNFHWQVIKTYVGREG